MIQLLRDLRKKMAIGVVGGSDAVKITEQLSFQGAKGEFNFLVRVCQSLNGS